MYPSPDPRRRLVQVTGHGEVIGLFESCIKSQGFSRPFRPPSPPATFTPRLKPWALDSRPFRPLPCPCARPKCRQHSTPVGHSGRISRSSLSQLKSALQPPRRWPRPSHMGRDRGCGSDQAGSPMPILATESHHYEGRKAISIHHRGYGQGGNR